MPRAADAKVWNNDLVVALEHRSNECSARNSLSRMAMWQRGTDTIRSVSKDIYMTKSTQIIKNLPNAGRHFPKSVRDECEAIMRGAKPIIPRAKKPRNNNGDDARNNTTSASSRPRASMPTNDNYTEGHLGWEVRLDQNPSLTPTTPMAEGTSNYRHPYLNSMQRGGGGYSLLLAFHHHPKPGRLHRYKAELIRDAQNYCDDAMEIRYFDGPTQRAGWKSMDSLVNHRLVHRTKNQAARAQVGFRGGPRDEFTLTEEGRRFIVAMLAKWPEAHERRDAGGGTTHIAGGGGGSPNHSFGSPWSPASLSGMGMAPPTPSSKVSQNDEKELREWLQSVQVPGQTKEFLVSKARRKHLHRLVDFLQHTGEYVLNHESKGHGGNRSLTITFEGRGAGAQQRTKAISSRQPVSVGSVSNNNSFSTPLRRKRALNEMLDSYSSSSDSGQRLGGGMDTITADPRQSAARAAERRMQINEQDREEEDLRKALEASLKKDLPQHDRTILHEGKYSNLQQSLAASLDAEDMKMPAIHELKEEEVEDANVKKALAVSLQNERATKTVIDLNHDDEDDDLRKALAASLEDVSKRNHPDCGKQIGRDQSSSSCSSDNTIEGRESAISIIMDCRERVTNKNPRQLMDGINKYLNELRQPSRHGSIPNLRNCSLERRQLSTADFAWVLSNGNMSSCLVERKKIGDLVGRSSGFAGMAHMEQIDRLRRIGSKSNSINGFLLLEGPLGQANRSIVNDNGDFNGPRIDTREAIYGLVARLVVNGWTSIQVLHTLDHEGTCRQLALMSALVASTGRAISPSMNLEEFNRKYTKGSDSDIRQDFNNSLFLELFEKYNDRARARQVADGVTNRFRDMQELQEEYAVCDSDAVRKALLIPLLLSLDEGKAAAHLTRNEAQKFSSAVLNFCYKGKKACARSLELSYHGLNVNSFPRRRVYLWGPLAQLLSSEDQDPCVVINEDLSNRSESEMPCVQGLQWINLEVREENHASRRLCIFVVRGSALIEYIQSVHDVHHSDWQVASNVSNLLQDDLEMAHSKNITNHSDSRIRTVILFDGVMTEIRRTNRGSRSDQFSAPLRQRLRDIVELSILILRTKCGQQVVNIHESQAVKEFLRSLVITSRDEAFLYFQGDLSKKGASTTDNPGILADRTLSDRKPSPKKALDLCDTDDDNNHDSLSGVRNAVDLTEEPDEIGSQESDDIIDLVEESQESVIVL